MKSRKRTRASRSTASESTKSPRPTPSPLDVAARILTRAPRSEADLHAPARGARLSAGRRPRAPSIACRELGYVGDEKLARERARSLRERGAGSLKIAADLEGPRAAASDRFRGRRSVVRRRARSHMGAPRARALGPAARREGVAASREPRLPRGRRARRRRGSGRVVRLTPASCGSDRNDGRAHPSRHRRRRRLRRLGHPHRIAKPAAARRVGSLPGRGRAGRARVPPPHGHAGRALVLSMGRFPDRRKSTASRPPASPGTRRGDPAMANPEPALTAASRALGWSEAEHQAAGARLGAFLTCVTEPPPGYVGRRMGRDAAGVSPAGPRPRPPARDPRRRPAARLRAIADHGLHRQHRRTLRLRARGLPASSTRSAIPISSG